MTSKRQTFQRSNVPTFQRPEWPLLVVMAVLFVGPVIAPLFQATRLPGVAGTGALARDLLSLYVCPTPAKSYMLLGFPMAVCARCWGATIGLWCAWLAFSRAKNPPATPRIAIGHVVGHALQSYLRLPWMLRLGISSLPFLLWVAEIRWWPTAPYWFLLLNGAFAGFWAGWFFYSIWPGLHTPRRNAHTAERTIA